MKRQPVIPILAGLLLLGSCEHKELCYDHPHTASLEVLFDWSKAPDASPASMTLYLLAESGDPTLRYDFTGCAGGTARVKPGGYMAVALNGDTEVIECRNTDQRESFEITTPTAELLPGLSSMGVRSEGAPQAPDAADERMAAAPDALWSARSTRFTVEDVDTLRMYPEFSVSRCTVEILGAENLEHVTGLSASLSGLSGGLHAATGTLSEERVTVPFALQATGETTLEGSLYLFGHCPGTAGSHTLIVYAVLTDGSKWFYSYDVTAQMHEAPDPLNIHIRLEGLPLPEPDAGGFDPVVDDWQQVEVDIEM